MKISYKPFTTYDGYKYSDGFKEISNMSMLPSIVTSGCWSPIIWRDGKRLTSNFIESSFLVLDFDTPGEESMDDINRALHDHKRVIATTRSHQIEKNGIICDRFRLIIPFSKTIRRYADYRYQYAEALKRFPWADKSCLDGARYFFPCKKIVYLDRDSEYSWDVKQIPPSADTPSAELQINLEKPFRKIPPWCLRFINDGVVRNGSRNMTLLGVCCELFNVGFNESEVRKIVLKAMIDWNGINVESVIKSAKSKIGKKS